MSPGFDRFWRTAAAGLCGSVAHTGLMALKSWAQWLPSFQPYNDLQAVIAGLFGNAVPSFAPWLLSYFNGAIVLGFLYGRIHGFIPGQSGVTKGAVFGVCGWLAMGVIAFPLLGKGLFGTQAGLGLAPAWFTLLMVLAYSVTLGVAYSAFNPDRRR